MTKDGVEFFKVSPEQTWRTQQLFISHQRRMETQHTLSVLGSLAVTFVAPVITTTRGFWQRRSGQLWRVKPPLTRCVTKVLPVVAAAQAEANCVASAGVRSMRGAALDPRGAPGQLIQSKGPRCVGDFTKFYILPQKRPLLTRYRHHRHMISPITLLSTPCWCHHILFCFISLCGLYTAHLMVYISIYVQFFALSYWSNSPPRINKVSDSVCLHFHRIRPEIRL